MKNIIKAHLPWVLIMLAITIQSSISNIKLPDVGINFEDKLAHFIVFGILGWFLARGMFLTQNKLINKYFFITILLIGWIFAFTDEWHQSMVPGRDADWKDWIADGLGILFFTFLYHWRYRRRKKAGLIS